MGQVVAKPEFTAGQSSGVGYRSGVSDSQASAVIRRIMGWALDRNHGFGPSGEAYAYQRVRRLSSLSDQQLDVHQGANATDTAFDRLNPLPYGP
ncbi:MAG: hypothetical protein ACI841_004108 [Planctomycetota bacterium]|jgi:hypothetical protein